MPFQKWFSQPDSVSPEQALMAVPLQNQQQQLIAPGTYAPVGQAPADILRMRQNALQGFSAPETAARREDALTGVEGQRATAAYNLARQQSQGGVTGGMAFAQQNTLNQSALAARTAGERQLFLDDIMQRRQAMADYQNTVNAERYGQVASNLATRQLGMQQQAQDQSSDYMQQMLEIYKNRKPEELPNVMGGKPGTDLMANKADAGWRKVSTTFQDAIQPRQLITAGSGNSPTIFGTPNTWMRG